jgi:hypothetical protein
LSRTSFRKFATLAVARAESRRLREHGRSAFPALQRYSALQISALCCEDPSRPRFFGLLVSQRTRLSASIKRFAYFAGVGILTHFRFFSKGKKPPGSGRAAVTCCAFERSRTKLPERTASARIAALRTQAENFTLEKIRSCRSQEKRSDGRAVSSLRVQGSLVRESFCDRVPNWESKIILCAK